MSKRKINPGSKKRAASSGDQTIESVNEFLEWVADQCDDRALFRGQHQDWPLLPNVARLAPRNQSILEHEQAMLAEFKRASLPFLDLEPRSDWEWLALAQHHGLPTRLLDWSTNPLAALWFAIHRPAHQNEDAVLWVFHATAADLAARPDLDDGSPFELRSTKVFQPRSVASRIQAQAGWFTVHYHNAKKKSFFRFETIKRTKSRLVCLRIAAKDFATLRYSLDRCGFNHARMFPDLDGLCRHIGWSHSLAPDENLEA